MILSLNLNQKIPPHLVLITQVKYFPQHCRNQQSLLNCYHLLQSHQKRHLRFKLPPRCPNFQFPILVHKLANCLVITHLNQTVLILQINHYHFHFLAFSHFVQKHRNLLAQISLARFHQKDQNFNPDHFLPYPVLPYYHRVSQLNRRLFS